MIITISSYSKNVHNHFICANNEKGRDILFTIIVDLHYLNPRIRHLILKLSSVLMKFIPYQW